MLLRGDSTLKNSSTEGLLTRLSKTESLKSEQDLAKCKKAHVSL